LSRIDAESRISFRSVGEGDLEESQGEVVGSFSQLSFSFSIIVPPRPSSPLNALFKFYLPMSHYPHPTLRSTFGILVDLSTGAGIQNGEFCIDMPSARIDPKCEVHFDSLDTNAEALFPQICFCESPSSTHTDYGMGPFGKIIFHQS